MYVEDALKALDRFGPRLAQIYGQGESPMTITMLSRRGRRRPRSSALAGAAGSAGRPYACVEVMVADEQDRPLPAGETGEILCRGDVVMAGLLAECRGERGDACAAASCTPATSAPSMPTAI